MAQHRSRSSRSLAATHSATASRSAHSVAAPGGPNTAQMWEAAVNGSSLQGGRIRTGQSLVGLSLGRRESQISEVLPVYQPGPPGYEEVVADGRRAGARAADEEGLAFAVGMR